MNKNILKRFEEKFIPCPTSGCWHWTGCLSYGYGKFSIEGKNMGAHRASYEIYIGPIPEGLHVCHSCDETTCVNPDHLWAGTHLDNMEDKKFKNKFGRLLV